MIDKGADDWNGGLCSMLLWSRRYCKIDWNNGLISACKSGNVDTNDWNKGLMYAWWCMNLDTKVLKNC